MQIRDWVAKGATAAVAAVSLAGCRLYEPERYARLEFGSGVKATRVLMIGNSLTYYNDLPGLLQQMSAGEAAPIYVEKITSPYASLKFHWDMGTARKRIAEGKWDYVVLQEFSRNVVTDPEESARYFSAFVGEVKRAGAVPILTENWTRRGKEAEYTTLRDGYRRIGASTGARVAPVGTAWRRAEMTHGEIELMIDDRHPTDAGTYLTAAVLYDVLYGKEAGKLPEGLKGPAVPAGVMRTLRVVADEVVREGR